MSDMTLSDIGYLLVLMLTALFSVAAALNLAAPQFVRRIYQRWAFPRGFYYLVGLVQGLTALFLAMPQTRIWGGILGAMVLFVVTVSLLNRRQYLYAVPAILAMLAIAPAMV
jgi:DoxX-like family